MGGNRDPADPKSYRPIALFNTMGKIFEAVVADCIHHTLEAMNVLPIGYLGEREGCACEDALQHIVERIHNVWTTWPASSPPTCPTPSVTSPTAGCSTIRGSGDWGEYGLTGTPASSPPGGPPSRSRGNGGPNTEHTIDRLQDRGETTLQIIQKQTHWFASRALSAGWQQQTWTWKCTYRRPSSASGRQPTMPSSS
ncbi:hypothetical protein K458DRAFT_121879 [Lentithecium fluviatile CBS 122367]|uniref:Uncharacterized protein n=1 Tax=Lentithecium fluviatile CBS 122367 TaxID=1168545 RepID=A0A6G1IM09_9PLEO|nr:hypothetical protein K458DRAFT_121879 [Lentithecium fluviatile CBS 122367]